MALSSSNCDDLKLSCAWIWLQRHTLDVLYIFSSNPFMVKLIYTCNTITSYMYKWAVAFTHIRVHTVMVMWNHCTDSAYFFLPGTTFGVAVWAFMCFFMCFSYEYNIRNISLYKFFSCLIKQSTTYLPCTGATESQSMIKLNTTAVRLVPDFRGRFFPIFEQ